MRILHTADWHLGRIFYRVHLTDDQAFVLDQLIDVIADTRPDVVVVAGDIYDRAVPPPDAVSLLDQTVSRIAVDHGVPMIMISGNHDSADRLGFGARMLARQNLHLGTSLSAKPAVLTLDDAHGPVDFVPVPFTDPAIARQVFDDKDLRDHDSAMCAITGALGPKDPSRRRVMVAHIHAEGGVTSDSERPLVVGGKEIVKTDTLQGFDYVALGHLHRPQNIAGPRVRYSGSLLKYSFTEADDHKSLSLVELDAEGRVRLEEIPLSARRDVVRVEGAMSELLEQRDAEWRDAYLEVTLTDEGPVVDAIGQLRSVFPHVLHIVRPHFNPQEELTGPSADHRRVDAVEIFGEFFEQVVGKEMSDAERTAIAGIVEEVDRLHREVFVDAEEDEEDEEEEEDTESAAAAAAAHAAAPAAASAASAAAAASASAAAADEPEVGG